MHRPENWLDGFLLLPRPEYAKQTESLLTDLLWRSPGSTLSVAGDAGQPLIEKLPGLKAGSSSEPEPIRLVPRVKPPGNQKVRETFPLAERVNPSAIFTIPGGMSDPVQAFLSSLVAPQARGDKALACVPVHPSVVALQTLHGIVNKSSPANLANAIEAMGWHGGSSRQGEVARRLLEAFERSRAPQGQGAAWSIERVIPEIAAHAWAELPAAYGRADIQWPTWPGVGPREGDLLAPSLFAGYEKTPFSWFWNKWSRLCDPTCDWHTKLPARRFVDWCLCLLRTGLAFVYLWEAEFYCRLHERVAQRVTPPQGPVVDRLRLFLEDGAELATIEPLTVPASQKEMWRATAELIAKGKVARDRIFKVLEDQRTAPGGDGILAILDGWIGSLPLGDAQAIAAPLKPESRTANNQKEFVKYLLLPRVSDDDSVDQADFYYLAQSNTRHAWFRPGPEWLVVVSSLLCRRPAGQCTLGELTADLARLGIRVERSVLVSLLEETGLSTDSPDADDALVIRSGF